LKHNQSEHAQSENAQSEHAQVTIHKDAFFEDVWVFFHDELCDFLVED
jgi:hypothetical protein